VLNVRFAILDIVVNIVIPSYNVTFMYCPKCQHSETKVYDSRLAQSGRAIRRRRECLKCAYRFTTVEEVKVLDLKVEKKNGQIVDFDQEKLETGIRKAFNKRRIDNTKVAVLVQKITEDILALNKNPIKSTRIGKILLKNLRNTDEAAYICYWAMFGNFETADEFNTLLKEFQKD
jgi:transcriptional repressor NrdR